MAVVIRRRNPVGDSVSPIKQNAGAVRIIIAERVRLIGQVIASALEDEPDVQVVGVATTFEDALQLCTAEHSPCNTLLVSTSLAGKGPLELVKAVYRERPEINILVIGLPDTEPVILTYIEAGAKGYILKDESMAQLLKNIRAAHNGEALISPEIAMTLIDRVTELAEEGGDIDAGHYAELTRREREVLDLIADDLTNQEIADRLFIEVGTVKNHVHRILEKLNVNSRHDAANYLTLLDRQTLAEDADEKGGSDG